MLYLNCRVDAGGRVPPSRFRSPPIEISALDDQTKKIYKFRPNIVPNCGRKLISKEKHLHCQRRPFFLFFGLHLILAKKHLNFRGRPFFSFFFFGLHSILATELRITKVLAHAQVSSRLQKRPPHTKFFNLSTGCR